jgi:dTDP-4-dehydrorhamnose reductase
MRILVTGASGLLGVNLAMAAAREHEVTGQVNAMPLQGASFSQITGDLLADGAVERMLDEARPDWVIHCAALADVDACEKQPDAAREVNALLPGRIASACVNRARLVYISTDAVFDGIRGGYTEEDTPNPLSIYARTKLDGESAVLKADPSAIVARINIFGWSIFGKRSLAEWFFYNLQAGLPVKGFTDVFITTQLTTDLAGILLEMLSAGLSGLYHVAGADCGSKYDFARQIARRLGADEQLVTPVSVDDFGLKAARSKNLCLNTNKLFRVIHSPLPRLSTGLDRFFDQYAQGYPHLLRKMVDNSVENLNPYAQGGSSGN